MDWRLSGGQALALYEGAHSALIDLPTLLAAAGATAQLSVYDDDGEDYPYGPPPWVPDRDGIVTIQVRGLLLPRGLYYYSWATSYDAVIYILERAEARAAQRGDVRAVVLDVDSPGGAAVGCFSCAERLRESPLPIVGVANPEAYSGGYALISAADRIYGAKDAGLGSIGVIMFHAERSRALDQAGVTVTVFREGERKARPNSVEPLNDADRLEIKADQAAINSEFVALVATHRGITPGKIQALQARCLTGADAVAAGLCDEIGGMAQARAWVLAKANEGKQQMSVPAGALPQAGAAAGGTPADAQSLAERLAAQVAAAREEGRKAGIAEERTRACGIVAVCDLAGLPGQAAALIKADKSIEQASIDLHAARASAQSGADIDPTQPGTGQGQAGKAPGMSIDAYVAANKIGGKTNG
ncbi:S49 family peptidase [Elstera sp.]|jgi:ClpP class serine protease|uniref:S49 family peptidase n=1 Tax=Elstera sp. TaxID=1916664 RepID=UPI0037BFEA0C